MAKAKTKATKIAGNSDFKVGDVVKHINSEVQGRIASFEHSGTLRALIEAPAVKGFYIVDVLELELFTKPLEPVEITQTLPEEIKNEE